MLDVLTVHNAKFAYQKNSNLNIYVKFAFQIDLEDACKGNFYYGDMKINGLPKDVPWGIKIHGTRLLLQTQNHNAKRPR